MPEAVVSRTGKPNEFWWRGGWRAGFTLYANCTTFALPYSAKQLLFLFDLTLKHIKVAPVHRGRQTEGRNSAEATPATQCHTHTTTHTTTQRTVSSPVTCKEKHDYRSSHWSVNYQLDTAFIWQDQL